MSQAIIRKLLEQQINSASVGVDTAFENVPYTPQAGKLWQRVNLLPGQTLNPTMGDNFKRDVGVMQVMVLAPKNAGPAAAAARAEAILQAFPRGWSAAEGAVRLRVLESPYVSAAVPNDAWYQVPVSIPYVADVN